MKKNSCYYARAGDIHFSKEDNLEISLDQGIIFNKSKKLKIQFEKLPAFLTEILEEGGILNRLKRNLKK